MKKAVIGIVDSVAQAEATVTALQRVPGIGMNDISVVLPDREGRQGFVTDLHTRAPEGAITGASAGGLLGGALGLLAGIGAIAMPGIGALIAAGPLLAALSGLAAGAAVGGVTGALVGLGIPEGEARGYESKLREGGVLVAVHTESREAQNGAREVLDRMGAHDVETARESALPNEVRPIR